MRLRSALLLVVLFWSCFPLPTQATEPKAVRLNEKLDQVRIQRLAIEKTLIDSERTKKSTESQLSRLKSLQKIQHQEKELTTQRLKELERYLGVLQQRREEIQKKVEKTQHSLRGKISKVVHPLLYENDRLLKGDEGDAEKGLRERIVSSVTFLELKELETLHADLQDAEEIENRIEQEKQQITGLMEDISEQESLIEFHKKLREDLTRENHAERLHQLEEYQKLKTSEIEIEKMLSLFQERTKLEHEEDLKKTMSVTLRPKSLPWPLKGKITGPFGQQRDETTGLQVFRKGIEILTMVDEAAVVGVMDGKVQFSGEIPGKGKVIILEHPRAIFTIYAGLKTLTKATGETAKASEKLGTMESQSPLYFEIRARSVAIDPVKWLQ